MSNPEVPLSSGFRWKLGALIMLLVLGIPAAVIAGGVIGTQLMSSLKEQVGVQEAGMPELASESFSPYGFAPDSRSGKVAFDTTLLGESATPGEEPTSPETEPEKLLESAPNITTEPVNFAQDPLLEGEPTTPEDSSAAADPVPSSSIFSLEDSEPRRTRQYRINVGTFASQENANALVQDLLSHGYSPSIEVIEGASPETPTQYRVLIGTFKEATDAGEVAEQLRRLGYNAWLSEKP